MSLYFATTAAIPWSGAFLLVDCARDCFENFLDVELSSGNYSKFYLLRRNSNEIQFRIQHKSGATGIQMYGQAATLCRHH